MLWIAAALILGLVFLALMPMYHKRNRKMHKVACFIGFTAIKLAGLCVIIFFIRAMYQAAKDTGFWF